MYLVHLLLLTCLTFAAKESKQTQYETPYKLVKNFSAKDIFNGNGWDFQARPDPTSGTVKYVNRTRALQTNILRYNEQENYVYLGSAHDPISSLPESLRIETQQTFNGGLFMFDVLHTPQTCGSWPAIWTVGYAWPNGTKAWPTNGEIDIFEGVNGHGYNNITLHTGPKCEMPQTIQKDCNNGYIPEINKTFPASVGCIYPTSQPGSFGKEYNDRQGGVLAMEWNSEPNGFIKVWQFPRSHLIAGMLVNPVPSQWGQPTVHFPLGDNCSSDHFKDHHIVINLTFCGNLAGEIFKSHCAHLKRTCYAYMQDPNTPLEDAHFKIRSVQVFTK
jgi:hypothetical protein